MNAELVDAALAAAGPERSLHAHDERHWRAVVATGLYLAPLTGADAYLVFAFGVLHDARRRKLPGEQGHHGTRAERLARDLHDHGVLAIEDGRLETLCAALRLHSDGLVSDDPTIGTSWDADRLQLIRVGFQARHKLLSTAAAKTPEAAQAAAGFMREPPAWDEIAAFPARGAAG